MFSMLSFAAMLTGFIFLVWIFFVIGEFESLTNTGFLEGSEEITIGSENDFIPDIKNNEVKTPTIFEEGNNHPNTQNNNQTDKIDIKYDNNDSQIRP